MYEIGARIQLHPATDEWMQGDRYGRILSHRKGNYSPLFIIYRIRLDSGRIREFHQDNVLEVVR